MDVMRECVISPDLTVVGLFANKRFRYWAYLQDCHLDFWGKIDIQVPATLRSQQALHHRNLSFPKFLRYFRFFRGI